MRKLILEEWMSLDGFVADKNGGLDFFTQLSPDENKYSDLDQLKFLETVDTILLGRKTYELFVGFWPTVTSEQEVIADRLNRLDKIVVSNTLQSAPWGQWPEATVMRGDAINVVKELKSKPGKDIVLWGSISLAQALMQAGLIDEYHIQVCPIILGGGRSLFCNNDKQQNLKLLETRQYPTGTTFLSYGRVNQGNPGAQIP
jgi:dihydrofolate reductase